MSKTILQQTFWILMLSAIAKFLSFIVRIFLARTLSLEAMHYYTICSPTIILLITIAQLGLPTALTRHIALNSKHRSTLFSSITLSIITNTLLIIVFILYIPILSKHLDPHHALQPILYSMIPFIPLVSMTGILKGYLYGKQKSIQATFSSIPEEITRIFFLIIFLNFFPIQDPISLATIAMLSIGISELGSCIYLITCLNIKKIKDIHPKSDCTLSHFKSLLQLSFPITLSRLSGSITYFLEPLLISYIASVHVMPQLLHQYSTLNAYVLPLLTLPSFFATTLSNYLLSTFTYHYNNGNRKKAYKLFLFILFGSFFIGISFSILIFFFSNNITMMLYHNTHSASILKTLAIPFSFYAIQPALSTLLHAFNAGTPAFIDTLVGCICRLLSYFICFQIFKLHTIEFALLLSMLITTIMHAIRIYFIVRH